MAISITRYVDITSSVGAGFTVPRRRLIGRIYTTNDLVPTDGYVNFTSASEVGTWFGTDSEEYKRALFYFSRVSKNGSVPPSIDFARYTTVSTFPQIFGNIQPQSLDQYTTITGGTFTLVMGAYTASFSAFNFTTATSLSDVASLLQTGIRLGGTGTLWSSATVTFDAVRGSFNIQGGSNSAPAVIKVIEGTSGQPIGGLLGWVAGPTLIVSDGIGATPPRILGNIQTQNVGLYSSVTDGTFKLTIGSITQDVTVDFSGVTTLAQVAGSVEAAIQAYTAGGVQWTSATVTYDATRASFDFLGGDNQDVSISVQEGTTGTPIGNTLGWVSGATLEWLPGLAVLSPVDALISSVETSNNFGSFLFMGGLGINDIVEIAQWNATQNVTFIYCVPVLNQTIAISYTNLLSGIRGTAITLAPLSTEYPEMSPMMILAATAYDQSNSVQNYMFQQFNLTPSVTTNADANFYDGIRVNYYGATQTAGTLLAFYQRGAMMGLATDPLFLNIYANEMWLKDAAQSSLLNLLINQNRIPANRNGQSQILAVLQSVIEEATTNGTISANKTLTPDQKAFITATTGDSNSWYQVQTIGYWVNCDILPYVNPISSLTEYKAVYTLIYSKDDDINLITGQQVLI